MIPRSLKPRISYSGSKIGLGVTDENVLGLGHTFDFLYRNDSKERQNYVLGSYTAYNLFGSYINAQILGERDFREMKESISMSEEISFHLLQNGQEVLASTIL